LGAAVDPRGESSDFYGGQRAFVGEMAVVRVGKPRWHDFLGDGHFHHGSPGAGVFVGQHGKRGCFAGAMAGLTVLLQDGSDVFGEGGRGIAWLLGVGRNGETKRESQDQWQERLDGAMGRWHSFVKPPQVLVRRRIAQFRTNAKHCCVLACK